MNKDNVLVLVDYLFNDSDDIKKEKRKIKLLIRELFQDINMNDNDVLFNENLFIKYISLFKDFADNLISFIYFNYIRVICSP